MGNIEIMKLFDLWNTVKKQIHSSGSCKFINEREVWYIHQWINVWYEENGKWNDFKRPVLVIKKVWNLFFVVSMTTKWKENKFYHTLNFKTFQKTSRVILSQVRILDKRRFIEKVWIISREDFLQIKKKLTELLL